METSLQEEVEKLTRETVALRKEILIIKAIVKQQNKLIQSLVEKPLKRLEICEKSLARPEYFPLVSLEDLENFENLVTEENLQSIVTEAKYLVKNKGFEKSLVRLLSQQIILDHNLDGKHGKGRLFNYQKLIDVLFKVAYEDGMTYNAFLDKLRAALQYTKKRHFQVVSSLRRKERATAQENSEDEIPTSEEDDNDDDEAPFPKRRAYKKEK